MDDPASSEGTRSGVAHLVGRAKAQKQKYPSRLARQALPGRGIEPNYPSRTAKQALPGQRPKNQSPLVANEKTPARAKAQKTKPPSRPARSPLAWQRPRKKAPRG